MAEEIRNGSQETNSNEDNWEKLVGDMLRLYRDMSGLWIDAVEVLMRSPEFLSMLMGIVGSNGKAGPPGAHKETGSMASGENMKVAVEIASKRRAQVTLDLRPTSTQAILHVHTLHAADPVIPPLPDVSFRLVGDLAVPILQLNIPEKQPAATYTGVVVDHKTNEARGTLCVRVLP